MTQLIITIFYNFLRACIFVHTFLKVLSCIFFKYYHVLDSKFILNFLMVILTTLFRRGSTLFKSTLKMAPLPNVVQINVEIDSVVSRLIWKICLNFYLSKFHWDMIIPMRLMICIYNNLWCLGRPSVPFTESIFQTNFYLKSQSKNLIQKKISLKL